MPPKDQLRDYSGANLVLDYVYNHLNIQPEDEDDHLNLPSLHQDTRHQTPNKKQKKHRKSINVTDIINDNHDPSGRLNALLG